MIFGVTKKNDVCINEIWSEESLHHLHWATATMPRDRFKEISANLLFDDLNSRISRSSENPKFYKFSEIFFQFQENLRTAYVPGQFICVDETLYAFRGRFGCRQYIKSKPARYGIKFNNLVDVATSILLVSYLFRKKLFKKPGYVGW